MYVAYNAYIKQIHMHRYTQYGCAYKNKAAFWKDKTKRKDFFLVKYLPSKSSVNIYNC